MTPFLFYATFVLLGLSLLSQFLPPYGKNFLDTSSLYWPISLSLLLGSTLLFGALVYLPSFFLSVANTLAAASFFSLSLLLISLKKNDPHWGMRWFVAGLVLFFSLFELVRLQGADSFSTRIILFSLASSLGAVSLVIAIFRYNHQPKSAHLYLMGFFAIVAALLLIKRAEVIVIDNMAPIFSLKDETGLTSSLRWISSVCIYMAFLMMRNHLGERLLVSMDHQRERAEDAMFHTLRSLAVAKHMHTGNHIRRLQMLVELMGDTLKNRSTPNALAEFPDVALMKKTCVLHDIGKIGLSSIVDATSPPFTEGIDNPALLSSLAGEKILQLAEDSHTDQPSESMKKTLQMARMIAGGHRERWDGKGFPRGLAGERIPLPARIVAVANGFDTLLTDKVYKDHCSFDEAVIQMEKQSGTAFDPDVLEAFLINIDEIQKIATLYKD